MKAMRAVLFLVASSSHGLQATPGSKVARGCRGGGVSQVSLGGVAVPGGEWYANELKSAPMRTRMWTSGAIAGGGDVLAQTMSGSFDVERLVAFVLVNALFFAPIIGPWFGFLSRNADRARRETQLPSWFITGVQTAVDQTVGAVTILGAFFVVNELFKWLVASVLALKVLPLAPAWDAGVAALQGSLMVTMRANWKIWPVANYLNFAYVPAEFQLLVSNVVAFFWSALLSAIASGS